MKSNLPQHPCANKCTNFRDGQCHACLIQQVEQREFELGIAPDGAYVKCDFIKGDVVVYMNHIKIDDLKTVEAFQPAEYYWLEGGQIIHKDDIQLASSAELKAKRRLDPPAALFISGEL